MGDFVATYGMTIGVVLWVITGLVSAGLVMAKQLTPQIVKWRQEAQEDQREHNQKIEVKSKEVEAMKILADLGSQAFNQQQLTELTSEAIDLLRDTLKWQQEKLSSELTGIRAAQDGGQSSYQQSADHTMTQIVRIEEILDGMQDRWSNIEAHIMQRKTDD